MHDGIKLFMVHCDELKLHVHVGIESGTKSIQGLDCELCFVLMYGHCCDYVAIIAFTSMQRKRLYLYFVPPLCVPLNVLTCTLTVHLYVHNHGM